MTRELEGRVAVVTGASRGIGLATARELASAGARVALVSRDQGRSDEAAAELEDGAGTGYACDVSRAEEVKETIGRVEEDLGPIDILINNAGVIRDQLMVRITDEDWDYVMSVNLKGSLNTMRTVGRGMMRRQSGVIINVSSVVGLTGNAGQALYSASKAGIVGLTKSVARELAARGIRANIVAPGFISTEMTADLPDRARQKLQDQIAMGRFGEPEDVASVIRFLAGPGASYITGQVIVVDGGMVI